MADNVETLVMRFEPDDAASKRVEQSAQRLAARITKLKNEVKGLQDQARDLNKVMDKDDKAFEEAIRNTVKLEKARKELRDTERDLRKEVDATATAQRDAAEQARLYGDVESRTRAITGAVGFVGGAGGAQVERTVNVGAEVLASAEAVGLLKQELPELARNLGVTKQSAAALGLEAIALAGAFVIIKGLTKDIADGAAEVRSTVVGQIDAYKKYNEFIATATSEELITRLEEVEQRRAISAQTADDLRFLKAQVEAGLDISDQGVVATLGEAAARGLQLIGKLGIGIEDLDQAIAEAEAETQSYSTQFGFLVQAYTEGKTAANDAAAREREYTTAKLEGLEREKRIQIEAATITQDQLDKRLQALEIERTATAALLAELQQLEQTEQVVAKIEEVNTTLDELGEETRLLNEIAGPAAEAHEQLADAEARAAAEADLLAKNTDIAQKVYQSAAAAQIKLSDQLAAAEQKRLDAAQNYADKTTEIEQDRNLKLVQEAEQFALDQVNALADHYQEMAELDQAYYEDRGKLLDGLKEDLADIDIDFSTAKTDLGGALADDLQALTDERLQALKDYNTEAQRAAEDHYKRLQQIQRNAQNDIRSASAKLDALGIYEAQKAAEEQLAVEQDQYDTDKKRRDEDFRDQLQAYARERRERIQQYKQDLKDLEANYRQQRQERIADYRKQVQELNSKHQQERQAKEAAFQQEQARERQRRQLELQQQAQQWALEDQQRQAAYTRERDALNQHYSAVLSNTVNGLYQVELAYQAWLDAMAARTSGASTSGSSSVSGGSTQPTAFAAGGYPPIGRDVLVGERGPEIVRFQQPARVYPNGQRPNAMDGVSIVINIDGSRSPVQVGAQVRKELSRLFKEQ